MAHDPPTAALLALRGYVEKTAAQVHEAQGDAEGAKVAYREAERFFRAAIELDPTDVGALNGQGNILLAEGQYQKAAVLGRIVTSYRPDYAAAFWDLGITLGHLRATNDNPRLLEELAAVYEALVALIPKEPSRFHSGRLEVCPGRGRGVSPASQRGNRHAAIASPHPPQSWRDLAGRAEARAVVPPPQGSVGGLIGAARPLLPADFLRQDGDSGYSAESRSEGQEKGC